MHLKIVLNDDEAWVCAHGPLSPNPHALLGKKSQVQKQRHSKAFRWEATIKHEDKPPGTQLMSAGA